MIKSNPVSGVVYSLCKRALSRSFAISVAENRVINDSPNTVMPGVSVSISNRLIPDRFFLRKDGQLKVAFRD